MFTYELNVSFILSKCVINVPVQLVSNVPDFEVDDGLAIDLAYESLEFDGLSTHKPMGIDVEVVGVYGGDSDA